MSFFKSISTNVARAKQVALSKVGQAESTSDPQFNQSEAQFKAQYSKLKKLYKLLQEYQHAIKDIGSAQDGIGTTMVEQYAPTDNLSNASKVLKEQTSPEIEQYRLQMEQYFAENFYKPLDAYLLQYKALEERIAERGRRLVDMDRYNNEMKVLAAKPDTVPTRLQVAKDRYENKRVEYEALNSEIIQDIQKLIQDRSRFFDALFANMINGQMLYLTQSVKALNNFNGQLSGVDRTRAKGWSPVITDSAVSAFRPPSADAVVSGGAPPVASRAPPAVPASPVATALYPFQGQDHTELSFQAGDRIKVTKQAGEWWEGELLGKRGLFPANYVRLG